MATVRKHLRIHGRVQGVFYRAWSRDTASGLGLRGWVRNRCDGSVEMLLEGEVQAVERMIERCRKGSPAARVDRIDVSDTDERAAARFEERPTA